MKLEQSFEVAAPLEQVWQTLIDVEHVAPCLPGAAVTGRNDDGSYNGTFTVKIGPTTASYTGKLEMENIDEASHTATMQAQGTDKRGQGGAKATILSRLAPADGHGTRVEVVTDYHITGRLARFGRGGMIEDISERLLREFAKRLQSSLAAQPETSAAAGRCRRPSGLPRPRLSWSPRRIRSSLRRPQRPARGRRRTPAEAAAEPPTEVLPPPRSQTPLEPASRDAREDVPPPVEESRAAAGRGASCGRRPGRLRRRPRGAAPPPPPPAAPATAATAATAAAQTRRRCRHPPMPSEPMQGLSLMGSVVWGRIKRNPAPAAAAGVAVVLLMARRRRRRHSGLSRGDHD